MWFQKKKEIKPNRSFVSVRMEAIGGQGANSAGKILAEAAVLGMGYSGNHFSSFGSEKRGSPVRSYVRFSTERKPIRTASSIQKPDLLVLFHESLLETHQELLEGVSDITDVVLNSKKSPSEIQWPEGTVLRSVTTIDATKISMKTGCGLNAVMLGALSEVCHEVDSEKLLTTLEHHFSKLSDQVRKNNLNGFKKGQSDVTTKLFHEKQSTIEVQHSSLPQMGWLNAPLGGVIVNPGNSVLKDHSASRKGVAPAFTKEICFNCGFCDMVCPDYCFVWKIDPEGKNPPELQGIDYQYCKGCQKCITVCPVEALTPVLENSILEIDKKRLFPELNSDVVENRWKKQDWTKYVEELSKEGQMLTLQTELLDIKSYLKPNFPEDILEKTKKLKS
jgi:pyruvate ferredoxin oxidoreductase gamma subunit